MKANELRIGNWVIKSLKSGNGRKINSEIRYDDLNWICEDLGSFNYEPISLTEEWLIRFGFKWDICSQSYWNGMWNIVKGNAYQKLFSFKIGNSFFTMEYVHQLQNLYFALTGEELTIKP
jgi:hypothetical protein